MSFKTNRNHNENVKSTCILAAAAALFALNACKEKGAETADGSAAKPEAKAAAAAPLTAETYEKAMLDAMDESSKLLEKFASGGSKEDYIAGLKALAAKNAHLKTEATPELQAKLTEIAQSPKFMEAAQKSAARSQEIIAKHPEFVQKFMDPEVQKALQDMAK